MSRIFRSSFHPCYPCYPWLFLDDLPSNIHSQQEQFGNQEIRNRHPILEFLSSKFKSAWFLFRLIRRPPQVGSLSSHQNYVLPSHASQNTLEQCLRSSLIFQGQPRSLWTSDGRGG